MTKFENPLHLVAEPAYSAILAQCLELRDGLLVFYGLCSRQVVPTCLANSVETGDAVACLSSEKNPPVAGLGFRLRPWATNHVVVMKKKIEFETNPTPLQLIPGPSVLEFLGINLREDDDGEGILVALEESGELDWLAGLFGAKETFETDRAAAFASPWGR